MANKMAWAVYQLGVTPVANEGASVTPRPFVAGLYLGEFVYTNWGFFNGAFFSPVVWRLPGITGNYQRVTAGVGFLRKPFPYGLNLSYPQLPLW